MPLDALTLPQLSEALGTPYRTLHSWVERELVTPSVHRTTGTGRANLFDPHDALTVSVLVELRDVGVKFELLQRAAEELDQRRGDLHEPVYLLVNGDVEIVAGADEVASALARDRLTVAYYTRDALERVREVFAGQ
jgi:DNA-binding transcriptional MerR regulator